MAEKKSEQQRAKTAELKVALRVLDANASSGIYNI
jgi:hypothetical protein